MLQKNKRLKRYVKIKADKTGCRQNKKLCLGCVKVFILKFALQTSYRRRNYGIKRRNEKIF